MPEPGFPATTDETAAGLDRRDTRPWWRLPTRSIVGIGLALLIVSSGLFAVYADQERRHVEREAIDEAQNLSLLLSEHAQRFLDASHLVTTSAVRLVEGRNWDEVRESRDSHEFLRRLPENFPFIEAVGLANQQGELVLTSRVFPAPRANVAEREHFYGQRATDAGPFVSRLLLSQSTGRPSIYMSRRINDEQGRFRGVATAIIDPRSLYAFYGSLKPTFPVIIDLFRSDLATLIRYPVEPSLLGDKWDGANYLNGRPEGGLLLDVIEDGVRRIDSFNRVGTLPVYASVSVSWESISAAWRKALIPGALFAGTAVTLMLVVLGVALVHARKEEVASLALRELADNLEDRVRERTHELALTSERLARHVEDKEHQAREANHRVKNSLQLVGALLRLQGRASEDKQFREQLEEASNRVASIAQVHDKLYRSDDLKSISAVDYLSALCDDLERALMRSANAVRLTYDFAPVRLIADKAILVGLVVTELVNGAARWAFQQRGGAIQVRLTADDDALVLTVADDGDGEADLARRVEGFSNSVVTNLVDQLEGTLERQAGPDGTTVTVTVPVKKA